MLKRAYAIVTKSSSAAIILSNRIEQSECAMAHVIAIPSRDLQSRKKKKECHPPSLFFLSLQSYSFLCVVMFS